MEAQNQLATFNPTANAAAIYQRISDPLEAITKMGQMFASSGMFGCSKVEQGQVLALACLVQGKDPFELMRNYYIINGSLSMKSVAVLANFMKAGGKVKWHSTLNDGENAVADFEIGENKLDTAVYTIEDAKREGLIAGPNKHNWAARPADMLRARLITKAVRMIAPGIIMGMQEETDAGLPTAQTAAPLLGEKTAVAKEAEPKSLEELIADDGTISLQEAIEFFVDKKLLEEGQTLADLTGSYTKKVAKNFDGFVVKVREFVAAKAVKPVEANATS